MAWAVNSCRLPPQSSWLSVCKIRAETGNTDFSADYCIAPALRAHYHTQYIQLYSYHLKNVLLGMRIEAAGQPMFAPRQYYSTKGQFAIFGEVDYCILTTVPWLTGWVVGRAVALVYIFISSQTASKSLLLCRAAETYRNIPFQQISKSLLPWGVVLILNVYSNQDGTAVEGCVEKTDRSFKFDWQFLACNYQMHLKRV